VLANPWVRTESGHARSLVQSYYRRRFFEREFWGKFFKARVDLRASLQSFGRALMKSRNVATSAADLPTLLLRALTRRACPTLFILSGNDLVASEFRALPQSFPAWRRYLASPHVRIELREECDHTFSSAAWRDQVADITRAWMLDLTRALNH
jgi:hypothetical protein